MASRPKKARLSLNDSLRDLLECPVCLDYCKTPIFMCSNGHHVCNKCQSSWLLCPTCRVEGQPSARCLVLEKIADKLKIPCANKREGCDQVLNSEDMAKHWETCKIKYAYSCQIYTQSEPNPVQCNRKGDRQALVAHVKKEHPGCYSEDELVQNDVTITFEKRNDYTRLVSAHNELFWVELWLYENTAYIFSRYIGREENANSYFGRFVCRSAGGFIEQTASIQSMHVGEVVSIISPYALRLVEIVIEQFTSENVFSFTAQIIKK